MTYKYDEALKNCLRYFGNDELASSVMVGKYLIRNDDGGLVEAGPDDLIKRLCQEFARIERKYPGSMAYEDVFDCFDGFRHIVPQGSPLAGIGNRHQITSIANCFILASPVDSFGGICRVDEQIAQIEKRRGGVGLDLSTLRPRGTTVRNSARTSDGVTCFMEKYSQTTKGVAQNGRRGALLLSLDCRHPDLESFINIKRDLSKVTAANISVRWHDDFLKAVEKGEKYILRFPVDAKPEDAVHKKEVDARRLWRAFVESAHFSAEPGCLFWDRMTGQSLSDLYEGWETVSTNPCGEIGASAMASCILMLINLASFVDNKYKAGAEFNFDRFAKYVAKATRLIDDMVDLEIEKINQIIDKVRKDKEPEDIKKVELDLWSDILENYEKGRRTGLGITALGDCLAAMGLKYGSKEALKAVDEIFKTLHTENMRAQAVLAKERGPFSIWSWDKEKDCHYIKILPKDVQDLVRMNGRRNISTTTCSPAGTISLVTRTTSGVEPLFKREYTRMVKFTPDDEANNVKPDRIDLDGVKWRSVEVRHPGLAQWIEANPGRKVEDSPYHGCEAGELDWRTRIETQAVIQKYITHSVSSTCNLRADVSVDEVSDIYLMAWRKGLKGITIYREGCREGVLVSKKAEPRKRIVDSQAPHRPDTLECEIHYSKIKGGDWIFLVGLMDGRPYEIFGGERGNIVMPKKFKTGWIRKNGLDDQKRRTYDFYLGSLTDENERILIKDIAMTFSATAGSYTRIISAMLRHGIPIKFVCEQLNKDNKSDMFSFEAAAARILKKYISDGERASGACESCHHEKMVYKDGCAMCPSCGWSKCG